MLKEMDLQLFADGDETPIVNEPTVEEKVEVTEPTMSDVMATIATLAGEVKGLKDSYASPEYLTSLSKANEVKVESEEMTAEQYEENLVAKVTKRAIEETKNNEMRNQIEICKLKHLDYVDHIEEMVAVSTANPKLTVEEVYRNAKLFKQFMNEQKKTPAVRIVTQKTDIVPETTVPKTGNGIADIAKGVMAKLGITD